MRRIAAWLIFPVSFCLVFVASLVALEQGVAVGTVTLVATLGSVALVASLERIQPFVADWNHSKGDLATDALYLPTYLGVNALVEPFVRVAAVATGVALSEALGMGLWPTEWSLLAQSVLACVVVEGIDYWPHRWLHEVPALWRFHAIHHNPKRVYFLNATRAHPVEIAFRGVANVIPLALLGAGGEVIAMVAVTNAILGMFQHANVDFELGPLTWIFSVGEMHRWHHSVDLAEANSNYGSNFLFWDVVFGTRFRDASRRAPFEVGIQDDDLPSGWWPQLFAPFRAR